MKRIYTDYLGERTICKQATEEVVRFWCENYTRGTLLKFRTIFDILATESGEIAKYSEYSAKYDSLSHREYLERTIEAAELRKLESRYIALTTILDERLSKPEQPYRYATLDSGGEEVECSVTRRSAPKQF